MAIETLAGYGILRTRVHLQELTRRSDEAQRRAGDAEQHEPNLAVKLDPYPWALRAAAPGGVGHAKWTAALDQAIRLLFPAP